MLKVCAATSYTQDFAVMGKLCTTTLRIYSRKHGYTLRVVPDLIMPDWPPAWHKVRFIRELFDEDFDFVLWMDADTLFVRYDRDIREVVEPGKDLYIVRHRLLSPFGRVLGPYSSTSDESIPNTGVMLLRNCEWTRGLLQEIWNRQEYRDHRWWEQAALIDLLGYVGLLGKGKDQPNKALLDHIKFIGLEWNSLPDLCSASHPIVHRYAWPYPQIHLEKVREDYLLSSSSLVEDLVEENEALARQLSEVEQMISPTFGNLHVHFSQNRS